MTVSVMTAPALPTPTARRSSSTWGRLLRLELRRNVMLWLVPVAAVLFWIVTYRRAMALPAMWDVRATSMQTSAVSAFAPMVVGAAAWMGSREGRHGMSDLVAGAARSRWSRQLAVWAATTCWALVAYLGCVGALYVATAWQGAWGGPLWWPAIVGAASLPALSALGFAAGVVWRSRFTSPLAAIVAFLALEISLELIHGDRSYWQISPLVAGPWNLGPDTGAATFYRYLPDLPIAQLMFLGGLTAVLLGALGVPVGAGGATLRRCAAALTAVGLLIAGTAVVLAGSGRLDAHGLIAISALHDAVDDQPVRYTPVCSHTPIPICLHPAYASFLPAVVAALQPVLTEVAGLAGAPVTVSQAAPTYREESNGVAVGLSGPFISGTPPVFHFLLPDQIGGPTLTGRQLVDAVRADAQPEILGAVIGDGKSPAQAAVMVAMRNAVATPGSPVAIAAARFAAVPAATRHAWLMKNLVALRAGEINLDQLP